MREQECARKGKMSEVPERLTEEWAQTGKKL